MSNRRYFTELTRVQIPAILHLTRIGYTYFGKISEDDAGIVYDSDTNILLDVFKRQFALLNPKHKDCLLYTSCSRHSTGRVWMLMPRAWSTAA